MVTPPQNLKEPLIPPGLIPTVRNQPILRPILHTIPNRLHRMSPQGTPSHMLIDPALISREVLIDSKRNRDRPIGTNLGHHLVLPTDTINPTSIHLAAIIIIPIGTLPLATRSLILLRGTIGVLL